jgi:uncharacterized protein
MKIVNSVAYVLLIVGGLNWGLVGLFDFNLVQVILGSIPQIETLVYLLVGISAVVVAVSCTKKCKTCKVEDHSNHSSSSEQTEEPTV